VKSRKPTAPKLANQGQDYDCGFVEGGRADDQDHEFRDRLPFKVGQAPKNEAERHRLPRVAHSDHDHEVRDCHQDAEPGIGLPIREFEQTYHQDRTADQVDDPDPVSGSDDRPVEQGVSWVDHREGLVEIDESGIFEYAPPRSPIIKAVRMPAATSSGFQFLSDCRCRIPAAPAAKKAKRSQ
jgi:hypothetical protein